MIKFPIRNIDGVWQPTFYSYYKGIDYDTKYPVHMCVGGQQVIDRFILPKEGNENLIGTNVFLTD